MTNTILVIAENNTANMGDNLIFEGLTACIHQARPDFKISTVNLSIASSAAANSQKIPFRKRLVRFGENRLPGMVALMQMNAQRFLFRSHLDENRALLQQVDFIIIGGGQLLLDNALGFPTKLQCFARLAHELNKPYHILSCGIGEYWSLLAREMFTEVLTNAASISLRDPYSIERLRQELPALKARLAPDPALWTADLYPASQLSAPPVLGICPINRLDFNRHLPKNQQYSEQAWLSWWFGLLGVLTLQRTPFRLFTTGVPQDNQFAWQLLLEFGLSKDTLLPAPVTPAEYCQQVQGFSRVITTRLHAAITAHSYGIPALGIIWDEKVRSYFKMIGRASDAMTIEEITPSSLPDQLAAIQAPTPAILDEMKQRTASVVASTLTSA